MNIDTEFLRTFVNFLNRAFPADLDAKQTVERADIMVYGLATKLCSLTGTKLDFLDWASKGAPGGGGPHHDGNVVASGPGKGGPHPYRRLESLVEYAVDVASPELADAYRDHPVVP
jgi:hypothetical protein